MELRPTVIADPRTSLVRVWGSCALLWMSLSWWSTDIWEMKKIISLHYFGLLSNSGCPHAALLSFLTEIIPQKEGPSDIHSLSKEFTWCSPSPVLSPNQGTELGWSSLFVSPSRSSCRHPGTSESWKESLSLSVSQERVLKDTTVFVLPSSGGVPTHCQVPEETSALGEKPPIKTHPSNLELLVSHFSVGCRRVCWRKSKENYF